MFRELSFSAAAMALRARSLLRRSENIGAQVVTGNARFFFNLDREFGGHAFCGAVQPVPNLRLRRANQFGQRSLSASLVARLFKCLFAHRRQSTDFSVSVNRFFCK